MGTERVQEGGGRRRARDGRGDQGTRGGKRDDGTTVDLRVEESDLSRVGVRHKVRGRSDASC